MGLGLPLAYVCYTGLITESALGAHAKGGYMIDLDFKARGAIGWGTLVKRGDISIRS